MNTFEDRSLSDVHSSIDTTKKLTGWRKLFRFLGPAYLVSVGYMDPGNWATDIEGGARYGYQLIWVLVMSNLMAILLQSLCARLGIVYQRDLAQANRDTYPGWINIPLYILAEIAIAATDLAEVLGMAIGLKLLFGIPLLYGVLITLVDTFLILYLQKLGMRFMEAFIVALVAIILICFMIQIMLTQPSFISILKGVKPSLPDDHALYIAIGIIGATVMPHNLYLHSALVQTRKIERTDEGIRKAIKFNNTDSIIALNAALLVNAAILILAGTIFYGREGEVVTGISEAHSLLAPLVGTTLSPILFAIALIAAGQSSTITGTLAGQIVMEGYLKIRLNPWLRRLLTRAVAVIPAVIVILLSGEHRVDDLLVFSQVILSVQLAFAIIPLIIFVSDKKKMGKFAINKFVLFLSCAVASVILYLNIKLIFSTAGELIQMNKPWITFLVYTFMVGFFLLLLASIIYPFYFQKKSVSKSIHTAQLTHIPDTQIEFKRIAMALDFSSMDEKVIQFALNQGGKNATYTLIHINESAGSKVHGQKTLDQEALEDEDQLIRYSEGLKAKGYHVEYKIGYRNRIESLAKLIAESKSDLLVVGSHGHSGIKDVLYGETINKLRHKIHIPMLVVK